MKVRTVNIAAADMTMRDVFAGQAMQGLVSALKRESDDVYDDTVVARLSYAMADAMLNARRRDNG